jgi:hypothetical protein
MWVFIEEEILVGISYFLDQTPNLRNISNLISLSIGKTAMRFKRDLPIGNKLVGKYT